MELLAILPPQWLTFIEWSAVVFSLLFVIAASRAYAWAWPMGIIGSALGMVLVFEAKLYIDVGLYAMYVLLGFYGWYQWLYGNKDESPKEISKASLRLQVRLFGLGSLFTLVFGFIFSTYTDADIPYWDALTTGFSLVATYLQAQKYLENWLWWIVIDALYVGVYSYKGLPIFAGLFVVYVIIAAYAFWQWQHMLKSSRATQSTSAL